METEAKFRVSDRRSLEAVARIDHLGPFVLSRRRTRRLRTVYLDTSSRQLERARVALRLRRSGTAIEATLKGPGRVKGSIHRRSEWTWRLWRFPRFPWRPPASLRRLLPRSCRDVEFFPIVETRVLRRTLRVREVRRGETVAEIALDEIEYRIPGIPRRSPREFEIEIESVNSGEETLRSIVRCLARRVRLRGERRSKLERALRWARSTGPRTGG
jgi:inorganic triphosphatase YgiF